jgi:hypothetical protein
VGLGIYDPTVLSAAKSAERHSIPSSRRPIFRAVRDDNWLPKTSKVLLHNVRRQYLAFAFNLDTIHLLNPAEHHEPHSIVAFLTVVDQIAPEPK